MTGATTLALVGTTGGADTTRTAVEFAATLARDGRDVAVLDAAYATQGLAQYVPGDVGPDVTRLCLGDDPISAGLVDLPLSAPGRVACCPAFAPFERVARAKSTAAARRFEELVAEAAGWFDHVLLDTPPVAANQAVAAVTAADRVALVTPGTRRGADAVPRMAGRLADVGVGEYSVVATRGSGPVEAADAAVPGSEVTEPGGAPASPHDDAFAAAVAGAVEATLGRTVEVETEEAGLREYLPGQG